MRPGEHFDDFGKRLGALIHAKCGPRQVAAVARRARMHPNRLSEIVRGWRMPGLRTVGRILAAIPATKSELFYD